MSTSPSSLAVITGASSGIGRALANEFAAHGFDVVIAAEDADLDAAATELAPAGVTVVPVRVDLSTGDGVESLYSAVRQLDRPVDALAVNAGIGAGGAFASDTDLRQELQIVDLNCRSTVHLTKLVLRDMVTRRKGRILFTSSIASTMPGAYQAVYNASKSFVQSFALALRTELKESGVTVTSLMPGPTDTDFFARAGMRNTKIGSGPKDDPSQVARDGFEALMAGKERIVAGSTKNKIQAAASRLMPDRVKAELHRRMAEPKTGAA
jgi:uncharacterized protein